MKTQWCLRTPVGNLFLVASAKGLEGALWKRQPIPMARSLCENDSAVQILAETTKQLEAYLSGQRKSFSLPLVITGTKFQREVWQELNKIPFGKTCSYKDIAKNINNPKAVRAVGTANGKNPFSIIVPCHRVISADGTLGGYANGLEAKRKLLKLEGSIPQP